MKKILIIEDDEAIRYELKTFLNRYNYNALIIDDFANVVKKIEEENADLILLDINLPIYDGFYICREIRKSSNTPIIVVTSRDSDIDELMSMNLGADDFITKPYNTQILLARINAILKRVYPKVDLETIRYKDLILNLSSGTISYEENILDLTKNEIKILSYMMDCQYELLDGKMDSLDCENIYGGSGDQAKKLMGNYSLKAGTYYIRVSKASESDYSLGKYVVELMK